MIFLIFIYSPKYSKLCQQFARTICIYIYPWNGFCFRWILFSFYFIFFHFFLTRVCVVQWNIYWTEMFAFVLGKFIHQSSGIRTDKFNNRWQWPKIHHLKSVYENEWHELFKMKIKWNFAPWSEMTILNAKRIMENTPNQIKNCNELDIATNSFHFSTLNTLFQFAVFLVFADGMPMIHIPKWLWKC